MYPRHQQQPAQSIERQTKTETRDSPWSDLRLCVPNTRSDESIVSFVECTLVELTHEDVGAEYVSSNVWGVKRTQFIAVDDVGETFQKRHFDDRLGSYETTLDRTAVREELIARLTQAPSSAPRANFESDGDGSDTFHVKPVHALR